MMKWQNGEMVKQILNVNILPVSWICFKFLATSVWFPLCWLRRKVSRAKGNPFLLILEYSSPRPKFQTQIWISNFVGAKFSRWYLRITSFWCQLRSSLGLDIPGDYSGVFLFAITFWGLIWFSFIGELHEWWNDEVTKWWNGETNPKRWNGYFVFFSFSHWGLLCFYFLGELHQSPKRQDWLHYPRPIRGLRIYIRLKY